MEDTPVQRSQARFCYRRHPLGAHPAFTPSIVAQISNLLYRRFPIDTLTNGAAARWFITVVPINAGTFTNDISFLGGSGLAIFDSPSVVTVLPSAPALRIRLNNGEVELYWSTNNNFRLVKP